MMPTRMFLLAVPLPLMTGGIRAEERAVQLQRDAVRLDQTKKIALVPVVVQLRFDRSKEMPDPNRAAARAAAASRVAALLDEKLKPSRHTLLSPEVVTLALRELNWQPTDLYVTHSQSNWDSPAQVLRNKKADEVILLNSVDTMKQTPTEMTCYRFKWHDLPDVNVGLAAFQPHVFARVDLEKAKSLCAKVGADALLFVQVTDMEVHQGGGLGGGFKSTRLHLHCTLLAANDGAVLWQARARGLISQKAGFFTGASAYRSEERTAIEAMTKAVDLLLADLLEGKGERQTGMKQ